MKIKNTLNKIQCSKCKKIKDSSEYYPSFLRTHKYHCKECEYTKQKNYKKRTYIHHPKVKLTNDGKLICRKCRIPKSLNEFHNSTSINQNGYPRFKTGHYNICKICCSERTRDNYNKNKSYYLDKCCKRRRNIKFIPIMENPFPPEIEIEFHHINDLFTIPIPKSLHRKDFKRKRALHRKSLEEVINNIYGFNINSIINGEW